jgi:hypothetical protein
MKHKCSQCGHVDTIKDAGRTKGGKARWKGTTKKQRSKAASDAAKARWLSVQNVSVSGTHPLTDTETKKSANG